MKIYVVFEIDRYDGYGAFMLKAFYSRREAEKFCEANGDYIGEVELDFFQDIEPNGSFEVVVKAY